MSQNDLHLPTTGVFSGLTAANDLNNAIDALVTANSGTAAPTNALGGSPKAGQTWLDTTSATLPILKRYTGAAWVVEAVIDVSNGLWLPVVGGGLGTIASAGTCDIGGQPQSVLNVTGTTTITALGSSAAVGQRKTLIFGGILTLTRNASLLIIPGGLSKTTAAGDVAECVYLGSGNWRVVNYIPIAGTNVTSIAGNTGIFTLSHGLTNSTNDIQIDVASIANFFSGLTLSTAGSSATFSVAVGAAADSTNADLMKVASAMSKTTSAWAVGNTNGGLDTGAIANNTLYHAYLIKRPDTGVVDVLVSLSATSPTLPTNYTLFRRISSMKTDGSAHWVAFTQVGRMFLWAVPPVDMVATTIANTRQTLTLASVPTGVVVQSLIKAMLIGGAGAAGVNISALAETDAAVATGSNEVLTTAASATAAGQFQIQTNTSAQIAWRATAASGATLTIQTAGWSELF